MLPSEPLYNTYLQILQEELLPAMGCTEPIAIAYGAAKAREVLGCIPESVQVEASGNLIKNVKSVIVPNTGGLIGIEAAAAAGIIAGRAEKLLEVIAQVSEEEKTEIRNYLDTHAITVYPAQNDIVFDLIVTLSSGAHYVKLRIMDYHTNIVCIEKDGNILMESNTSSEQEQPLTDRSCMNVAQIIDFVETVDISLVADLIRRQIQYNYSIAEEGIRGNWGANIGSVLLHSYGNNVNVRAKAMAAAGSDARMSGCEMPVMIVSGSGNQGITASVPVVVYAKHLQVSEETMLRAVLLSDLVTIHLKTGIGRLSAYCGAVSAGSAAGAAIAWLNGGDYDDISHTLVNSLAIVSGIICDGAKPSCAAKIAAAVDTGILGHKMYQNGQQFYGGDGIVSKGVENTIRNIGQLGHDGMRGTDYEIIRIMTQT